MNAFTTPTTAPTAPGQVIADLLESQVLTEAQAAWLARTWPHLDKDTFAHPALRSAPEHSRFYLEREASRCHP